MAINKMQEPMYYSTGSFSDRVPYWWRFAPQLQTLYRSEAFNICMVLFVIVSVVCLAIGVPAAIMSGPAFALLGLPFALSTPYLGMSTYLKAVHRPLQGSGEFKQLRVDRYRSMPRAQQREFKSIAKLVRDDPTSSIIKDYQYIIDNQQIVTEVEQIPSSIKTKISIAKDEIKASQQAKEIMRERGWDKEIV